MNNSFLYNFIQFLIIVLCGAIFFDVIVYFYYQIDVIFRLDLIPLQSLFLLIVLISFMFFSLLILFLYKKRIPIIITLAFFMFGVLYMGAFYSDYLLQVEPFELIYVVKEISIYVIVLCIAYAFYRLRYLKPK